MRLIWIVCHDGCRVLSVKILFFHYGSHDDDNTALEYLLTAHDLRDFFVRIHCTQLYIRTSFVSAMVRNSGFRV